MVAVVVGMEVEGVGVAAETGPGLLGGDHEVITIAWMVAIGDQHLRFQIVQAGLSVVRSGQSGFVKLHRPDGIECCMALLVHGLVGSLDR